MRTIAQKEVGGYRIEVAAGQRLSGKTAYVVSKTCLRTLRTNLASFLNKENALNQGRRWVAELKDRAASAA